MINTKQFYETLIQNKMDFFAGVPDSLLQNLCACITENCQASNNIITANEGNAVGIAAGYHIATGKYGVVYMQNSGMGNAVNPLLSLADRDVYSIPMLLIIGWRGQPGIKDEPQHITQGRLTIPLLETMDIEYKILEDNFEDQIKECFFYMKKENKPIALIVKKGSFDKYNISAPENQFVIKREQALKCIIDTIEEDSFVVSTTGKTSREIYEIREHRKEEHKRDFLTVGSMGHTSSIALGMSMGTKDPVYCIDGDGSFLMHLGGMGIASQNARNNFKYILINNGAHESVGGQPTIALNIDCKKVLEALGFENVYEAKTEDQIKSGLANMQKEKQSALIIYVNQGSREDLGRPAIAPVNNKRDMMEIFLERQV